MRTRDTGTHFFGGFSDDTVSTTSQVDTITKIALLTSQKNHNGARILGAQYLKHAGFEKIFRAIKAITDVEGGVPRSLQNYRNDKLNMMIRVAMNQLGPEDGERFRSAF